MSNCKQTLFIDGFAYHIAAGWSRWLSHVVATVTNYSPISCVVAIGSGNRIKFATSTAPPSFRNKAHLIFMRIAFLFDRVELFITNRYCDQLWLSSESAPQHTISTIGITLSKRKQRKCGKMLPFFLWAFFCVRLAVAMPRWNFAPSLQLGRPASFPTQNDSGHHIPTARKMVIVIQNRVTIPRADCAVAYDLFVRSCEVKTALPGKFEPIKFNVYENPSYL